MSIATMALEFRKQHNQSHALGFCCNSIGQQRVPQGHQCQTSDQLVWLRPLAGIGTQSKTEGNSGAHPGGIGTGREPTALRGARPALRRKCCDRSGHDAESDAAAEGHAPSTGNTEESPSAAPGHTCLGDAGGNTRGHLDLLSNGNRRAIFWRAIGMQLMEAFGKAASFSRDPVYTQLEHARKLTRQG